MVWNATQQSEFMMYLRATKGITRTPKVFDFDFEHSVRAWAQKPSERTPTRQASTWVEIFSTLQKPLSVLMNCGLQVTLTVKT